MKEVWNTRVFTDTEVNRGNSIRCDFSTGIVTLEPGSYHITGFSMVTYNSGGEPPEMTTIDPDGLEGISPLKGGFE